MPRRLMLGEKTLPRSSILPKVMFIEVLYNDDNSNNNNNVFMVITMGI